jgi:DNA-binding IclR family transcriptional regulator
MSRSTTHRYVITLVALGYLEQGASRKYRLGLRVMDSGTSALNGARPEASANARSSPGAARPARLAISMSARERVHDTCLGTSLESPVFMVVALHKSATLD